MKRLFRRLYCGAGGGAGAMLRVAALADD